MKSSNEVKAQGLESNPRTASRQSELSLTSTTTRAETQPTTNAVGPSKPPVGS